MFTLTHDFTFLIYLSGTIIGIVGFFLFGWWWFRSKRATPIYVYITFLFLAFGFEKVGATYARYIYLMDPQIHSVFVHSLYWTVRSSFTVLIFGLIVLHMIFRLIIDLRVSWYFSKRKKCIPPDQFRNIALFVDDNEQILDMVKNMMERNNVFLYTAKTSKEALKLLSSIGDLNLCFIDLHLGGDSELNGLELGAKIKKEFPWMVVIAITGFSDRFTFLKARASGYDDYFVKPYPMTDLIDVTKRQLLRLERWREYKHIDQQRQKEEGL